MVLMPDWLEQGLIIIETIVCAGLIGFEVKICYSHPDFVFQKVPIASLYITSLIGVIAILCNIWMEDIEHHLANEF